MSQVRETVRGLRALKEHLKTGTAAPSRPRDGRGDAERPRYASGGDVAEAGSAELRAGLAEAGVPASRLGRSVERLGRLAMHGPRDQRLDRI